ncbi:MAG TPA: rhodanese-like domain-containing protein, partial [Turneriella sp.]|nr:rhodanese-like domain-containing protein [Turneriella sp.]HNA79902.1 rhodanese-like domain-containing protein [Turneriella sp.]HNE19482.1 rhodanese-like domain-containing protein [Turneriella sp.]HNJ66744.1 rhodanese-like domain-containing protein [Turneriella sp.]HNL09719.1 rhodanese-like domain-containing protein [Turneriella sp.]
MKKLMVLLAAVTLTVYCEKKSETTNTPASMSSGQAELKALLDGKATVVDVRTPGEFASGHHPRAVNIPVDQVQSRIAEFGDKSKPVVVYCASGNRSGRAKQILQSAGYKDVTNAGGFSDLP